MIFIWFVPGMKLCFCLCISWKRVLLTHSGWIAAQDDTTQVYSNQHSFSTPALTPYQHHTIPYQYSHHAGSIIFLKSLALPVYGAWDFLSRGVWPTLVVNDVFINFEILMSVCFFILICPVGQFWETRQLLTWEAPKPQPILCAFGPGPRQIMKRDGFLGNFRFTQIAARPRAKKPGAKNLVQNFSTFLKLVPSWIHWAFWTRSRAKSETCRLHPCVRGFNFWSPRQSK